MTHEEREQALSEEDYTELRDRFGSEVESVVRDMVSGKGERWEQAESEDAISLNEWHEQAKDTIYREDVIALVQCSEYELQDRVDNDAMCDDVRKLLSVKSQEPKTGHWIPIYQGDEIINYRCSECEIGDTNGSTLLYGWNYCRRCGAKMIEPQESEVEEVMSNRDLFNEFVKNYPDMKVNDYRPLWLDVVKGKPGITIWLDNGDVIFYFPNVNLADRLFCEPYKAESEDK